MKAMKIDVKKLSERIDDTIIKTIIAIEPFLVNFFHIEMGNVQPNTRCFQILGIDILIDDNLKPWLMEINANPSLSMNVERIEQQGNRFR